MDLGFRARHSLQTVLMIGAAFAGGALTAELGHATGESASPHAPLAQMARVLVFMENNYVDPVSREAVLDGAIKGMVSGLDPHSAYMTPREFAQFNEDTEGTFGGIGVEVDFKDDKIVIIAPIPETPAQRAGIESGDEIVAVDGKVLRGLGIEKIVELMRGPPQSRVKVSVRRKGAPDLIHFDLVREHIHIRSAEGKMLDGGVAYLRFKQFQAGSHGELIEEIAKLRKIGTIEGVILDLRSNPGGLIDEAQGVADEFLSGGAIYSTRHRGKILDEVRARGGGALTRAPLVVLVNEYSASSSELVAGALQDNDRAVVVGSPTFGKGSVQTIYQLPGGAGLRLTTMRYYTPSGQAIQAAGIQPDVLIQWKEDSEGLSPMREGDLDGALAPEQRARRKAARVLVGDARPKYTPTNKLPTDPRRGDDFALKVAYEEVRTKR
jgi:carboxyl-terminal processing protease